MDTVADVELLHWLQRNYASSLSKSILTCQKYMVPNFGGKVLVLSDGEHAHFHGLTRCRNKWICPVCSVVDMSKYANDVACAIEALKSEYAAIMVTLTVPHIRNEPLSVVYNRLQFVWKGLLRHRKSLAHKDGFSVFYRDCGIQYYTYAVEITYGVNGWHPHIHALFWVKRSQLKNVDNYVESINKRCDDLIDEDWRRTHDGRNYSDDLHQWQRKLAFYVSRDADDRVHEQTSSLYLSGWQADKEISGNVGRKASHDGHMSIYQLTVAAYNNDATAKIKLRELCEFTFKKSRHTMSNNLPAVIKLYKQTESYTRLIIEKKSAAATELVFYFSFEQWSSICCEEFCRGVPIRSTILRLATQNDARRRIMSYLSDFDINVEVSDSELERLNRLIA